jgi:O-antigen/teichoic acid export membrane protein
MLWVTPGYRLLAVAAPVGDIVEDAGAPPSLRGNSVVRLVSETIALAATLVTAALTARYLGPSGKGYYSSLMLLGGMFVLAANAGLGDAAIVVSGRGEFSLRDAAGATIGAVLALALVGAALSIGVSELVLPGRGHEQDVAIFFTGALVAVNALYLTALSLFLSRERVVLVGVLSVANAMLSTAAVWTFLVASDLGVEGAVLGSVVGAGIAMVSGLAVLPRVGVEIRPRVVAGYLRAALRYGVPVQMANVLVLATGRLDLILVYHLRDASTAGRYSIALTIGTLVSSASMALSFASFPRLARLPGAESRRLARTVVRTGTAAAVVSAAALAAITPVAVPLVFGSPFRGAIVPTLILIPAGVLWSLQWLLCRAAAAQGAPRLLFSSFALSFLGMIALDVVLIDPWGATGAAIASLLASGLGCAIAVRHYLAQGWTVADLLPGRAEFGAVAQVALRPGSKR